MHAIQLSHHSTHAVPFYSFCISWSHDGSKILVSQVVDSDEAANKLLATKQSGCFAHLEIISEAVDRYSIGKVLQGNKEL